ncbi:pyruvate oxidase [Boudabousia liubingyangii]|uniref:pyruvate dehydrogenase n=1 Tax=Boudabousia liubingyangii TaxID=1921764 RepID=UPI00093E6FDD|nr:pyruvate dehydrogenase [Boudabousia liubingyangii]OKL46260.1 pyruvate oxidase [Boudabousia liubingyangii]
MATVAEMLVEQLELAGVERVYGIVGDSLNPIVDAIRRSKKIRWIHVRHEEVAAFAAGADAEVTGKLAVCAGSCGPGNLHLINGLYDCQRNRVPVLAIASHIPATQIGTQFFQETHPDRIFNECSVFSEMISDPNQMPRVSRIAIESALTAPGVSVLTIPSTVTQEKAPEGKALDMAHPRKPRIIPNEEDLKELADAINEADKVALFCGAGTRGAHDEVMELAGKLYSPVGHSLRGKEWIQWDNPYDVGMSGLLGYGAAQESMEEADLLVLIGTDFPYDSFLPHKVRTAQIDINPMHLGRRTRCDISVQADVRETLKLLIPMVEQKKSRSWLDKKLKSQAYLMDKVVGAYTEDGSKLKPIHPEFAAVKLDEAASDDAIFTVDTGMCNVWAARYITPNGKRRVIGSFLHGSMANALPQAIGAAVAEPHRQVVAMCGDGGLSMLLGDLQTIKTQDLNVKAVVFNNSALCMVKLEMIVDGLVDFGTTNDEMNFAAIAEAMGIRAVRVTDPQELEAVLEEEMAKPGPAVIDIVTDPNALSIPPKIEFGQAKGFAFAMSKQILNGGFGEVMSMARSNLRNIPRRF